MESQYNLNATSRSNLPPRNNNNILDGEPKMDFDIALDQSVTQKIIII